MLPAGARVLAELVGARVGVAALVVTRGTDALLVFVEDQLTAGETDGHRSTLDGPVALVARHTDAHHRAHRQRGTCKRLRLTFWFKEKLVQLIQNYPGTCQGKVNFLVLF